MISIEQSIFKSLLFNEEYVRKVIPYLDDSIFDGHHRTLFNVYKNLFDKYNKVPTYEALAVSLQKEKIGESEFDEIADLVGECWKTKDDLPDTDWLIDETEAFCKDKKIYNAIYESINILEGSNKTLDKHAIPDLLDDALSVSFDQTIGMEFFDDAERRLELYQAEDNTVKFPLEALNILSNNGHRKKALSAILASTNVGKSAMMCYLAGEFMKAGLNVLYITLEMAEELCHQRVEANLLGIKTDELETISKEDYINRINKIKSKTHGKLFVKQYPTGQAHAGHFRHLLKELKQKKKFTPDFVFIDYINIAASSRYKSMSGVNSYSYIKAIAEEFRGLAVEFDIPIMTATQVNREGTKGNANELDMTSTSESFGLPATLDWFIGLSQDDVLAEHGQQLVSLLKTRWGNKSKVSKQLVHIDWDYMRYSDVGSTQAVQSAVGKNKPGGKKDKGQKQKLSEIDFD